MEAHQGLPPHERRAGSVWGTRRPRSGASDGEEERGLPGPEPGSRTPGRGTAKRIGAAAIRMGARVGRLAAERGRRLVAWSRENPKKAIRAGAIAAAALTLLWLGWRSVQLDVLVIGTDNSDGFEHTDTLMLVRYRPATQSAVVVSVPRDTLVTIPGRGQGKINAAYMLGRASGGEKAGAEAARKAVSDVLGESVPYYAHVSYEGFRRIVDLLGGVELDIRRPMHYDDFAGNLHIHFAPGMHRLDGKRALEYVRFRHDRLGDLGRIQRQQEFAGRLLRRMRSPWNLLRLPVLAPKLYREVASNLPLRWMILGSLFTPGLDLENVKHVTVPGKGGMFKGQFVWLVDMKASSRALRALDEELDRGVVPEEVRVRVEILNGSGASTGLVQVERRLKAEKGITVMKVGTLKKRMRVQRTQVVDRDGDPRYAQRIARILRVPGSQITTAVNAKASGQVTVVVGADFAARTSPEGE